MMNCLFNYLLVLNILLNFGLYIGSECFVCYFLVCCN